MAKRKGTNNDLPNITQKTKDRAIMIPLKSEVNSGAPEGFAVPVAHLTPIAVLLLINTNTI